MSNTYDLIVVGAGTAGIPCAITAAEHGANVVVVEKTAEIGGTMLISAGYMSGGGTKRQRERGIADSPEDHFEDILRISENTVDRDVAWLAVKEAPRTLDWLDDLGFPWVEHTPTITHGHEPYAIPRTVWAAEGATAILETLRPLWDRYVANGQITVLLKHIMTDFVFEAGAVVGVNAQNRNEEITIYGRNTVLTTGGYAANPRMFREVTPGYPCLLSTARPSSSGEAIQIAQKAGAGFRNSELHVPSLGGIEIEAGRADFNTAWAALATAELRMPREIYVNMQGERFLAEDETSAHKREHAVMQQTGHEFWVIFDEKARVDGDPLIRQWTHDEFLKRARHSDKLIIADDLDSLAAQANLPADTFKATIQDFNAAVDRGTDDRFGRNYLEHPVSTPPFYAVYTRGTVLISFGGLAVDGDLRVLNTDGVPISNLYAAGEAIGAGATCGKSFCGGMMVTPCLSFGRILGRRLSSEIRG